MTDLIVVQYADMEGKGFNRFIPANSPPVDREFVAAAEALLDGEVSQPRDEFMTTLPHPVWSLRSTKINPRRRYWCFAVQGRGGRAFGAAGTCRFMFAPLDVHPFDVWRAGMQRALSTDHPDGLAATDPDWVRQHLLDVLGALSAEQRHVRLPGTPTEAAALIGAVLNVLPRYPVAARVWATCLLQRPESPEVAAAALPDELRVTVPKLAEQLDQLLVQPPAPEQLGQRLGKESRESALMWLVSQASAGRRDDFIEQSRAGTMTELLDEIWRQYGLPNWPDVPALLETPAGKTKLAALPQLVGVWAGHEPVGALRQLRVESEPWIRREILNVVVPIQLNSRENLLGLPTAQLPVTDAHRRVGGLLVEYEPDEARRAELIRKFQHLGMLAGTADLLAARDWLERDVRLVPAKAPDLFPARRNVVEAEIGNARDLTVKAKDELRRADNPAKWLVDLAPSLGPVKTSAAVKIIAAPAELAPDQLPANLYLIRRLAGHLVQSAKGNRMGQVDWLRSVLGQLSTEPIPTSAYRAAMYGGLSALIEIAPRKALLENADFRKVCVAIGLDEDAPTDVRELFDQWRLVPVPTPVPVGGTAEQPTGRFSAIKRWWGRSQSNSAAQSGPPTMPDTPGTTRIGTYGFAVLGGIFGILVIGTVSVALILSHSGGAEPGGSDTTATSVAGSDTPAPGSPTAKAPASPTNPPATPGAQNPIVFVIPVKVDATYAEIVVAADNFMAQLGQRLTTNRKLVRVGLRGRGGADAGGINPGTANAKALKDYLIVHGRLKGLGDKDIVVSDGDPGAEPAGAIDVTVILA
jgi:hypothetical protein